MDVAVILPVHQGSSRVSNKMLRPFAGTSLFDIALKNLEDMPFSLHIKYYVAAHEEVFLERARDCGVDIIRRSQESARAEGPKNALGFLQDVSEEWVVLINACCPFLSSKTILEALGMISARANDPSFHGVTTVQKVSRWVWTDRGIIVNEDPAVASTKAMKPLLLASHGLYGFRPSYFFEHGRYWQFREGSPSLVVVDALESVDVDTPLDFNTAEVLYKGMA